MTAVGLSRADPKPGRIPFGKAFGATFLLAGTQLGAGILAMPIVSADMGFEFAAGACIILWALLTYTGLMMLEVCLAFPNGSEFQDIARVLFGRKGALVINIVTMLLLFTLSASYISGASSTYQHDLTSLFGVHVPPWLVAVVYTAVIATVVTAGAKAADHANRVFFAINLLILIALVVTIEPSIHFAYLGERSGQWVFIWTALPVLMTAFGFHTTIPTVVNYVGPANPRGLRGIFIVGGLIPLAAYLGWIFVSLGALPRTGAHSFQTVQQQGGSVGPFLSQVAATVRSATVPELVAVFSSVVLITSYLALSLSLSDILRASMPKNWSSVKRRAIVSLLCFVPPLAVATVYPNGFVVMLSVSAIFACIMTILFPTLSLWRLRSRGAKAFGLVPPRYQVMASWGLYVASVAAGAAIIVIQVLNLVHALPT
ncbi:MAG: hypothetical protein LBJ08_02995 [Bifidobacteriaceae bacterium]|jgi:tyrosine-specific transport protein|nr:hypothetical protein [Bifidobacteriaceae bacterium]